MAAPDANSMLNDDDFPESAPKRRRVSPPDEPAIDNGLLSPPEASETEDVTVPLITREGPQESTSDEDNPPLPVHPQPEDHLSPQPAPSSAHDTPYTTDADPASSPIPHPQDPPRPHPPPRHSPTLTYKPALTLHGHTRAVAATSYSPDGTLLASASADATAKIWDARTGAPLHTLRGHLAGVNSLTWSPIPAATSSTTPHHLLATASDDKTIRLWRVSAHTAKPHHAPLLHHNNAVLALAFSPKGNILVSGSTDEAVILWSVRSCTPLRVLPAHNDPVYGVAVSSDGTLVASCSSDGLVRIWDTGSGQCLRTFFHEEVGGGRPGCLGVRFSPNGRFVAGWYMDGGVRLWDYVGVGAGGGARCVKTYEGAGVARYSVAGAWGTYWGSVERRRRVDAMVGVEGELVDGLGEEGEEWEEVLRVREEKAFLVSGSEEGEVVVWDVLSKEVMQRLSGHKGVAFGVDVRPGCKEIVSCGADRTVRIWRMEEDSEEVGDTKKDEEMVDGVDEIDGA